MKHDSFRIAAVIAVFAFCGGAGLAIADPSGGAASVHDVDALMKDMKANAAMCDKVAPADLGKCHRDQATQRAALDARARGMGIDPTKIKTRDAKWDPTDASSDPPPPDPKWNKCDDDKSACPHL